MSDKFNRHHQGCPRQRRLRGQNFRSFPNLVLVKMILVPGHAIGGILIERYIKGVQFYRLVLV